MPIELPEEEKITVPAKPAEVGDKLWMTSLLIRTPGPRDDNSLVLEYQPWPGGTADPIRRLDTEDTTRQIVIEDVFVVAAKVPEMGKAMQAIIDAIPALLAYAKQEREKGGQ